MYRITGEVVGSSRVMKAVRRGQSSVGSGWQECVGDDGFWGCGVDDGFQADDGYSRLGSC